jgi:hypothetical protein
VRDDVVQLLGNADPLLADLPTGSFGLFGLLACGLLAEAGLVPPSCRHRISDEPRRAERHKTFNC